MGLFRNTTNLCYAFCNDKSMMVGYFVMVQWLKKIIGYLD